MSKNFDKQYNTLGMKAPPDDMDPREKGELILRASCLKLGIDPALRPQVHELMDKYHAPIIGLYSLMIIRDAMTDDREANWNSRREDKWGGYFLMNDPGFRFDVTLYDYTHSRTSGGSRLCTFSEEDQEFFMKECIAFWADFMGGQLPQVKKAK